MSFSLKGHESNQCPHNSSRYCAECFSSSARLDLLAFEIQTLRDFVNTTLVLYQIMEQVPGSELDMLQRQLALAEIRYLYLTGHFCPIPNDENPV